jgi:hypothetical protein
MVLETDFWDATDPPAGIQWQIITRDFDLGMPENDKRIIDFVLDLDSRNDPVSIEAMLDDNGPYFIDTIATPSRQQVVLPVPSRYTGVFFAKRLRLCLSGRASCGIEGPRKIYKLMIRYLPEAPEHLTHVTAWDNWGSDTPKFFRNLNVSLSTRGRSIDGIDVEIDGQTVQTVGVGLVALDQQTFDFGLAPDTRGTLARLKFRTQDPVRVFDYRFDVMPEPVFIRTQQTPWDEVNYQHSKLFKHVTTEIDTAGQDVTLKFWLDGNIRETWIVNTPTRQWTTHSLSRDSFGRLVRITVDETAVSCRLYGVQYAVDPQPASLMRSDSYDYTHGFPRWKLLRRLFYSGKNPLADVTLRIFADEILKTTIVIPADPLVTGFSKRPFPIVGGCKGKLFRFLFESPQPFEIYAQETEFEAKSINGEDGWGRIALENPKLL